MDHSSQTEIDAAIIECLRILARRGRQLREERERQQQIENTKETTNARFELLPQEANDAQPG